mmetsp:Transcript_21947/g.28419  ORF Transcript_21947/g.28419 Transcript_21947/m.28419 type:complete len:265 (-) Transcript_21947:309-1103(-)|eukprot:CAMPEP_0198145120 /NCGR_PEP_ID=MMETSP1443-20131203/21055_1 /TAXON_ID=186043 /ORGANISM="Entomoneis sp., Strain CCMP2396" /LENGTH=264 /DNA_ID=CAMNT_0043808651 /DNA_START=115 /DNA_END=909 /DNA_ORIENTATION=+
MAVRIANQVFKQMAVLWFLWCLQAHRHQAASFSLRPALIQNSKSSPLLAALINVDETEARSCFGTKEYWDDVYMGRGDFPSDCYTWYYGWEVLGRVVERHVTNKASRMLIPGIGNDDILLDLYKAGFNNLIGQDYSEHAVDRQYDLLSYEGIPMATEDEENSAESPVRVLQGDVTNLPDSWTGSFDVILEKGLLDAVYLSGEGNMEAAIQNFYRVLRPGGLLISVSGVVPHDFRNSLLAEEGMGVAGRRKQRSKSRMFCVAKEK